jgi:hypothetical protein
MLHIVDLGMMVCIDEVRSRLYVFTCKHHKPATIADAGICDLCVTIYRLNYDEPLQQHQSSSSSSSSSTLVGAIFRIDERHATVRLILADVQFDQLQAIAICADQTFLLATCTHHQASSHPATSHRKKSAILRRMPSRFTFERLRIDELRESISIETLQSIDYRRPLDDETMFLYPVQSFEIYRGRGIVACFKEPPTDRKTLQSTDCTFMYVPLTDNGCGLRAPLQMKIGGCDATIARDYLQHPYLTYNVIGIIDKFIIIYIAYCPIRFGQLIAVRPIINATRRQHDDADWWRAENVVRYEISASEQFLARIANQMKAPINELEIVSVTMDCDRKLLVQVGALV